MSKLVCRTALDGAFEKFRDSDRRIQKMFPPRDTFQVEVRIAPTIYGFWLVRMTSVRDQYDPGTLLAISPEKSARVPWVQNDPDRELHLFVRVNIFPEKVLGERPPEIVCNVYRSLNFSKESDRRIIDIQHYLAGQFSLGKSISEYQRNGTSVAISRLSERNGMLVSPEPSRDRTILHLEAEEKSLVVA